MLRNSLSLMNSFKQILMNHNRSVQNCLQANCLIVIVGRSSAIIRFVSVCDVNWNVWFNQIISEVEFKPFIMKISDVFKVHRDLRQNTTATANLRMFHSPKLIERKIEAKL